MNGSCNGNGIIESINIKKIPNGRYNAQIRFAKGIRVFTDESVRNSFETIIIDDIKAQIYPTAMQITNLYECNIVSDQLEKLMNRVIDKKLVRNIGSITSRIVERERELESRSLKDRLKRWLEDGEKEFEKFDRRVGLRK